MRRRGFLGTLAGAVLAVALDVLPSFGHEPETVFEWEEECILIVEHIDYERKIVTLRLADGQTLSLPASGALPWIEDFV